MIVVDFGQDLRPAAAPFDGGCVNTLGVAREVALSFLRARVSVAQGIERLDEARHRVLANAVVGRKPPNQPLPM